MKKDILIIALIGVLFVLVAGSIVASFSFYKEYKDKVDYLEQQSASGKNRIEGVEAKIDNFRSTVDDMTFQIKSYSDSMQVIQNTVNLSEGERKNLLSKLEDMKKDLQGWQKDYAASVIDIRQSIMSLKDDLGKVDVKSKEVELGKITVKQDENKAASPEPEKKKPVTSNFKSGSVRKVSSQ